MIDEEVMKEQYYKVYYYGMNRQTLDSPSGNEFISLRTYKGKQYIIYEAFDEEVMKIGIIGINPEYHANLNALGFKADNDWFALIRDLKKFNIFKFHYSSDLADEFHFKDVSKVVIA